jgi:polyphosphate kinase
MADTPSRYLNRELSWLEFNQGVLDEAHDANVPVLERL